MFLVIVFWKTVDINVFFVCFILQVIYSISILCGKQTIEYFLELCNLESHVLSDLRVCTVEKVTQRYLFQLFSV